MNGLIEKSYALDAIENHGTLDGYSDKVELMKKIMDAPTVDVGRCKHCKYYPRNPRSYYDNDEICTYVMCGRLDGGEDGFCSNYKPLGERKEE